MKYILPTIILVFLVNSILAVELTGEKARRIVPEASQVYMTEKMDFPVYIQFEKGREIPFSKFSSWINSYLKEPQNASFKVINSFIDKLGQKHYRVQQFYKNIPVDKGMIIIHTLDNRVMSMTGNIYTNVSTSQINLISKEQAVEIAKTKMNAEVYKWEIPGEEQFLKHEQNEIQATFYPNPVNEIYEQNKQYIKVYKLTLYSHKPIDKKEYIINSNTGEVLEVRQKLIGADVQGTAVTKYSGNQTITTDNFGGSYRLRETGRGNGIETYNANLGTSYTAATDFTDADNYWDNVNAQQDEVATDAHWATEKTYDFFFQNFGWNSIDNNGFALRSYVHYDLIGAGYTSNVNAFWDGQRMTYGDGNGTYSPLTTVDIAAHEITHGLTNFSADLIYQDESGALNEGYSDIFAAAVEYFAKPATANWLIGEDIGSPFRSLQDPNSYGDPDTYFGTNWATGSADNGGVHTNSQVIGHWFYLLCDGGSGTNDIGNSYNVNGIGVDQASEVAFRTLTTHLTPNSTYEDARFFSILSAIELYGPCTPQVESVTNAMYAVGLGVPYVPSVVADFTSDLTSACSVPFTINFQNISNNSTSFIWNFGDGNTSTSVSPTHTYNSFDNYTVSLIANGGTCGIDTTIKPSFVSIDVANPCIVVMPFDGTGITQTACSGTLYDGGGPSGNYVDNADAVITISPIGASSITLDFVSFDIEPGDQGYCNYDYLEIYDGPNTSAASLGQWCNTTGTPGTIVSTGGSLTLVLHSDQGLNMDGFEANWTCSLANTPPNADFILAPQSTCTGDVTFTDHSTNGPTSWLWNFGDGNTSTAQNPIHTYMSNGSYDVSLIATNSFGSDTILFSNIVTVNRPLSPIVVNDTICENEQASLSASGNGTINWFLNQTGGISFYTGNNYLTTSLLSDSTYYVENAVLSPSQYVGDTRSSSGGSFFNSNVQHHLVFDCFNPCKLVSVEVNANTAGNRVIQLKNSSGTILDAKNVNIPAGVSRINLDFDLPVGTNFQLVGPLNPDLWRNNSNCTYPYQISGLVSVKSSSASTNPTGYYYFFYDWEVKEADCLSSRVPITAYVEICQSIEENNVSSIKVFPNPTEGIFLIENSENIEISSIFISDIVGKKSKINDWFNTQNMIEVDISSFSKGVYFVNFETSKGKIVKKLVKK